MPESQPIVADVRPSKTSPQTKNWRRVTWAAILSFVFPGLGQFYAGSYRLGIVVFAGCAAVFFAFHEVTRWVAPTPMVVALVIGGIALMEMVCLGAAIDAGRRLKTRPRHDRPRWFRSTWIAAPVAFVILAGIDHVYPMGWMSFSTGASSMVPTLFKGDLFIADIRPGTGFRHGDLAVFDLPLDPAQISIKRVIGLPGDRIAFDKGDLWINGAKAAERPDGEFMAVDGRRGPVQWKRYIETLPNGREYAIAKEGGEGLFPNTPEYKVPAGSVFVLGDSRDNSLDSRMVNFGFVPGHSMIGRPETIYWSGELARILRRLE